ncbi:hypothetical protein CPB84DRAFT_1772939 [Gymnopilus junonius]|uniref:Uncharacterized protein n=1 Tax=Gymnopilus junonius TaxID=109634 RepID=A0A9P5TP00_GYMJU|nr:hypothetical protein CPB84DRAFT_1772939 [Gymnopilus junonius]
MHLFKRSKSIVAKNIGRQQDSSSSPSPSSSSRQPLVPQTNIDHRPPKSPLSPVDAHAPSSNFVSSDSSQTKRPFGRKISHLDSEGPAGLKTLQASTSQTSEVQPPPGLAPPPRSPPRPAKTNYSDMYTHNDLQTFSFGAAPSTSSTSLPPPVDPLSRPRDETDSDEVSLIPDTTPRPSMVGGQHPRSHQSQPSQLDNWPSSFSPSRIHPAVVGSASGEKNREPDSDTMSIHTFDNSSASASVSSLSGHRRANSRATSRVSGHSSTTPLTSANDLTSDDDDDMIGRHPLPPEPRQLTATNDLTASEQDLYLSEEEFLDDYEPGIEIDSVVNEASDRGTYYDYSNSRESVPMEQTGRMGSLAMTIPSTSSPYDQRARDYTAGRRPSRSLEDLRGWSFEQGSSSQPRHPNDYSIPGAPTSVPESEGDWRDLRKRSIQRDKDLPPVMPSSGVVSPGPGSSTNHASPKGTSAMDGFDTSWLQPYGVNGVVGIDPSEMADIVGENRASFYSFRKGSTASATRRQSTVSSNLDIMHKNITGLWASQKHRDQRKLWTFVREKDRLDEEATRRISTAERERPSIPTLFVPRPSTSTDDHPIPFFEKSDSKDKEKTGLIHKSKSAKEPWKGMALDSEELWFNGSSGRYRVIRRNAISIEAGKPPQQRLNITYMRNPLILNATNRDTADGPAVTIHKHSKAAAFSIGRHYRTKPAQSAASPHDASISLRHNTSMGHVSSKDSTSDGTRKKGNMILLGTRKVQRAYTSTNTTRKLESHGLLEDSGQAGPRDTERTRKDDNQERQRRKTKEKEKDKEKERKDKDKSDKSKDKRKTVDTPTAKRSMGKEYKFKDLKSKSVGSPSNALPDSSGSSAGSVFNAISSGDSGTLVNATPVTTPDLTESTSSAGSVGSIEHSITSQETTSSDRTVSRANVYRSHHRKRDIYDISDEDDSSDGHPRYPVRTPHRETYAALPPEVFESAHQENAHTGLFGWGRSKGGDRHGHRTNPYLEASYNPPWPVTQPRSNTKDIVEDLNTSFQDVGLLPAIGEIKGSSSHHSQNKRKREQQPKKHVKRPSDKMQMDIFNGVPEEALYMLLPLWPGETDPHSARKYPFSAPLVATPDRRYLMIYYKLPLAPVATTHEEAGSKSKSGEKKRSQDNPPSGEPANERAILLNSFHISARILAYRDLQGTGVRIPDAGLAVSGPLEDAFENTPPHGIPQAGNWKTEDDIVLGCCHSRDSGIEFYSEGFEKLGLARAVPNPRPLEPSEDDDNSSFDTIPVLTPMGRAVMEMVWLGSMALTSFNPNH